MKKLLVFFSYLVLCISANARELSFNKYADNLFTDSAYHAIIKKHCQKIVENKGIAQIHFESNFNRWKDTIALLSKPLIEKKFSDLEKKIISQKTKDKIAIQLLEKSFSNAIAMTLNQNKFIIEALSKKDVNDRIIAFDSKIIVESSGKLDVTETISIANFNDESGQGNNSIKRGITRDFPTRYTTEKGFISTVPFQLISITRNGEKENYKTENLSNGVRVFCGRSDYFLEEGIHRYEIHYTTGKQLKFHEKSDELYWNVTGNGWSFSIDKASCILTFPEAAIISDIQCYTGVQGSQAHECNHTATKKNAINLFTSKRQEPYEGFTISVSIQKGIIAQEETSSQIKEFAMDNKLIVLLALFVLLLFIILYRYWKRVGKDPKQGVIIPEFTPPAGLSPADVGYVFQQEYSDKLFTAALIDLAVQKKLRIQVEKEGLLFKSNVYKFLAPENNQEKEASRNYDLYNKYGFDAEDLFGLEIEKGTYNASFKNICTTFKSHIDSIILTQKTTKRSIGFLSLNQDYIGIGLFLLIAATFASIVHIAIIKPPLPTIIYAAIVLVIGFAIQIFFMNIIKSYSNEGRIIADQILGFKMYMETTEKNILDNLNPPEENIQLFEKYLPYAIALGIENKWSEKFKSIIEQSIANGYQPSYYSLGSHPSFSNTPSSFASAFSSGLSNTVSSAATPPSSSSSSGSGGGGFSGGGGGGGGGGGW
mgnify:CR=1 FL=1